MRINSSILLCSFLLAFGAVSTGCTRLYRPAPQWEAKFAAQSRYDVFPNDVREKPEGFTNTLVAWTGVITKIEYIAEPPPRVVRFYADHHYFDWVEDDGLQREKFFLSPRGEGAFAVQWIAETPDDQKFIDQFAVGDMLVAYGYPTVVRSNYVALHPAQNLRAYKPKWYRTDILDYGRPGEPVKVLRTAPITFK